MTSSRTRQFCNGCHSCKSPCGKEQKETKFSQTVTKVSKKHNDSLELLSDSIETKKDSKKKNNKEITIRNAKLTLLESINIKNLEQAYQKARYFEDCTFEEFIKILTKSE